MAEISLKRAHSAVIGRTSRVELYAFHDRPLSPEERADRLVKRLASEGQTAVAIEDVV